MPPRLKPAQVKAVEEAVETAFDKLLQKARNFGDDVSDDFQRLIRKDVKPRTDPKPAPGSNPVPVPPGTSEKDEDKRGDDKRVLTFGAAMAAVADVLNGKPRKGETYAQTSDRKREEENAKIADMTVLQQVAHRIKSLKEIGDEFYGEEGVGKQLDEIEARMKKELLTQKNPRKTDTDPGRTRRTPGRKWSKKR